MHGGNTIFSQKEPKADVVGSPPIIEIHRESSSINFKLLKDWLYLFPASCVIGLGIAVIPHFALGLIMGVTHVLAHSVILAVGYRLGFRSPPVPQEYMDQVLESTFSTVLLIPVIEELIFRGFIQGVAIHFFIAIAPATAVIPFLATGLNTAEICSIFGASLLFGAAHLGNNIGYYQPITSILFGIISGVLAIQFGLPVAIALHIANNLFLVTIIKLIDLFNKKEYITPNVAPDSNPSFPEKNIHLAQADNQPEGEITATFGT